MTRMWLTMLKLMRLMKKLMIKTGVYFQGRSRNRTCEYTLDCSGRHEYVPVAFVPASMPPRPVQSSVYTQMLIGLFDNLCVGKFNHV